MTAPTFSHSTSAAVPSRAIPPYAGPSQVSSELSAAQRVGPFVPAAQRQVVAWAPASAVATPVGSTLISATPPSATPPSATPAFVTPVAATPAVATPAVATPAVATSAVATPAVATPAVATPAVATPAVAMTATPTPTIASPAVQTSAGEMAVPASIPPYRPLRPTPIISPAIRTPLYIPPIATPTGELVVEDEGVIEPQIIHTAEFAVPQLAPDTMPSSQSAASDVGAGPDASVDAGELPWIDAFLASTPALPMSAVEDAAIEASTASSDAPVLEATVAAASEVQAELTADQPSSVIADTSDADTSDAEQVADEWPLEEAAAEFRVLRTAMDEQAAHDVPPAPPVDAADPAAIAPLPEWSDDDLMDIMPIRHSGKTPLSNAAVPPDGELWAERARKAQEEAQVLRAMAQAEQQEAEEVVPAPHAAPESTAEEAAHALELLARRVRAGELTLPAYDPRMGEPAALVAALAALLGVKLR